MTKCDIINIIHKHNEGIIMSFCFHDMIIPELFTT